MKCANCHQEILENNPEECPYCNSKNLIHIEDKYPDGFDLTKHETLQTQIIPVPEKIKHTRIALATLGIILLILGISFTLFGSTLPGNIAFGPEYGHSDSISIFGFLGGLLLVFDIPCWFLLLYTYPRSKPSNQLES